jgi:tripartite-type tricarboxylate transporter receptor subunit TctC
MPDVPTISEIGYRGPVTRSYFGFLAPSATPKPVLEKIAADVRAIASEPVFRDKNLIQRGLEPVFDTPDQFAAYVKEDRIRSKKVVEDAGLKQQ